jgi:hypothetical protein
LNVATANLQRSDPAIRPRTVGALLISAAFNGLFLATLGWWTQSGSRFDLGSTPLISVDLLEAPAERVSEPIARTSSVIGGPPARRVSETTSVSVPAAPTGGQPGEAGEQPGATIFLESKPSASSPAGLASLLKSDPCADIVKRLQSECRLRWAGAMAPGAGVSPQVLADMKAAYPGFDPPGVFCSLHLGCGAQAGGRNLNETRPIEAVSPMASGAGGLGGVHDLVGRLPPPNPYHVDPGFGD